MRLVVVLVVLGGLLVVSAFLWPRQRTDVLDVVTTGHVVTPTGVLSGRLAASRSGDLVCFAVRGGTRAARLVLPTGYAASRNLGVLDPAGVVVALRGDDVRITGRPLTAGDDRCAGLGSAGAARTWAVSSIRTS